MIVATHEPVDAQSPSADSTGRARQVLLRANGGFLAVVLTVAARDGRRFWHVFALAVHLFLGTANVAFRHRLRHD
jgi:hypothetical protein